MSVRDTYIRESVRRLKEVYRQGLQQAQDDERKKTLLLYLNTTIELERYCEQMIAENKALQYKLHELSKLIQNGQDTVNRPNQSIE